MADLYIFKLKQIFYLRNCRTFNSGRMGNKRIEIELVVVYLISDSESFVLV